MFRNNTKAPLVLSAYSDREAGRLALRNIRRAAAISSLPGGRIFVEDNGPRSYGIALAAGLAVLAIAVGYLLLLTPPLRSATGWVVAAILTMFGTLAAA